MVCTPDINRVCGASIEGTAAVEHWRDVAGKQTDLGPSVPVEKIIFVPGEPPERHWTKVGGLPYRPAGMEFPRDGSGRRMGFLTQFYMRDAQEFLGPLPGDVLVVFARVDRAFIIPVADFLLFRSRHQVSSYAFEWYPLGLENLVEQPEFDAETNLLLEEVSRPTDAHVAPDVMITELPMPRFHGLHYRSCDYLRTDIAGPAILSHVDDDLSDWDDFWRSWIPASLARYADAKIGGLPWLNQYRWDEQGPVPVSAQLLLASFAGPPNAYSWDANTAWPTDQFLGLNFFLGIEGEVLPQVNTWDS